MKTYDAYQGRLIVNQQPTALVNRYAPALYLDVLCRLLSWIELYTGHAWKVTSYIRDSPSHRQGYALDVAPDIAPASQKHYAVYSKSDPVLYKRETLLRQLQRLASEVPPPKTYSLGIYVEPDHLHLHVMKPEGQPEIRVIKFDVDKSHVYPDSSQRRLLPLLR